jgi:hypothetical protein
MLREGSERRTRRLLERTEAQIYRERLRRKPRLWNSGCFGAHESPVVTLVEVGSSGATWANCGAVGGGFCLNTGFLPMSLPPCPAAMLAERRRSGCDTQSLKIVRIDTAA